MSLYAGKSAHFAATLLGLLILWGGGGCYRGQPSEKPPVRVVPDMDEQPKVLPQSGSHFFADSAAMRKPVDGTVARGWVQEDSAYFTGVDPATGEAVVKSPVLPTLTGLQRGRERFDIYCSVCHSRVGDGKGILIERGYIPPPNFHSNLIRNYPDGHIFRVISNGIRNMPGYARQIPVADRWLIINYLRALQLSQNASLEDIPTEMRGQFK
jgi:mono/diheme cytochrome c family protein